MFSWTRRTQLNTIFTDETIRIAVKAWLTNEESASITYGHISTWNTENVTNMSKMFYSAHYFNADISKWNVSKVTNMSNMFKLTHSFNADISKWDVSKVTNMSDMFMFSDAFNADISKWDVSNVTNMSYMFSEATSFNADISKWDVSNVTNMSYMFYAATSFNADISKWDVSKVTNMSDMFKLAHSFNADISKWDVSNVTNMSYMFSEATSFNADISKWEVYNVITMSHMFSEATSFNADISGWEVFKDANRSMMFDGATSFDADISNWSVVNHTRTKETMGIAKSVVELRNAGKSFGAVTKYQGNIFVGTLMYFELIKEYSGQCYVYMSDGDKVGPSGIHIYIGAFSIFSKFSNYHKSILSTKKQIIAIKACVDRGVETIIIPLYILTSRGEGHANTLIYRVNQRVIERFEPHGAQSELGSFWFKDGNSQIDVKLKELIEVKKVLGEGITYKPPHLICPAARGLQSLAEVNRDLTEEGFCLMWSLFVAEMVLRNPLQSTEEVINNIFAISDKNPEYLRDVIRGYAIKTERTINNLTQRILNKEFVYKDQPWSSYSQEELVKFDAYILDLVFQSKSANTKNKISDKLEPDTIDADVSGGGINRKRRNTNKCNKKSKKRRIANKCKINCNKKVRNDELPTNVRYKIDLYTYHPWIVILVTNHGKTFEY